MSIVRLPEYEAEFEPEVFEIYALPRSDANGASPYLEKYHRPLVDTDAILDTRTGMLDRSEGILTWIIEGFDDRWGYSFEPHGVYKLLVKKAKFLEETNILVCAIVANILTNPVIKRRIMATLAKAKNPSIKKFLVSCTVISVLSAPN